MVSAKPRTIVALTAQNIRDEGDRFGRLWHFDTGAGRSLTGRIQFLTDVQPLQEEIIIRFGGGRCSQPSQ